MKTLRNIKIATPLILLLVTFILYACKKEYAPLPVAPYVDLNKYMGVWYEIARLPVSFQEGCYATKATYTLRNDGTVEVLNTCNKNSLEGKLKKAEGKAFVADPTTNAKLKVQFFWPFKGDYWILDVGENYQYAVVGEPSRENLWILSRNQSMNRGTLEKLIEKVNSQGFDTSKLIYTKHF
jgi:apolipoprotein D and lipocalin family protein